MVKGADTTQNNVPKKPRDYSSDEQVVTGGGTTTGGGFNKEIAASCLGSFKTRIKLLSGVDADTKFVLIPNAGHGLQLVSGSKKIGVYTGKRLEQLKQCIAGGYTYEGVIDSVQLSEGDTFASCTITGKGPA